MHGDDRYANQIHLPEVGSTGQERLRHSRVLVVGVGGLGAPASLYLAAAGVGQLGLIDGDAVEVSNLHRQIAYRTADVGRPKVLAAADRITALNPEVSVRCYDERLSATNLAGIFHEFDFVIDGTDRIEAKYLVNDGAVLNRVPFSHAGIVGFQGQTMTVLPGESACLRCLFPSPPPEDEVATCQEAGVVGALAGSIGVLQAAEALKYVLGIGTLLTNRLLTYDAERTRWRAVAVSRRPDCALCGDRPAIQRLDAIEPPACK